MPPTSELKDDGVDAPPSPADESSGAAVQPPILAARAALESARPSTDEAACLRSQRRSRSPEAAARPGTVRVLVGLPPAWCDALLLARPEEIATPRVIEEADAARAEEVIDAAIRGDPSADDARGRAAGDPNSPFGRCVLDDPTLMLTAGEEGDDLLLLARSELLSPPCRFATACTFSSSSLAFAAAAFLFISFRRSAARR
mmetsp:Transcript_24105/g.73796  ORF Transcript_24105/g.73796 Transcript_24105/m.73796 type:complete len:201 (+) Transcript_24105:76-678(+)